MKCKKAGILISALADGELSQGEQSALERHISSCSACAQEMREITELRRDMALWADETPSEWLAQNFSHKLRELADEGCVPVRQKARLRWGVLGPATAVFATAMLLIVIVLHNQVPPPVTREAAKSHPSPTQKAENGALSNPQAMHDEASRLGWVPSEDEQLVVEKPAVKHNRGVRPGYHMPARTRVAVRPARDTNVQPETPDVAGPSPQPGYADLSSRGGYPQPEPEDAIAGGTNSGVAPIAGAAEVKDNLGEAGLAMNETVERLRGTLQQAVDLLISKPPMPANGGTESHGGYIP